MKAYKVDAALRVYSSRLRVSVYMYYECGVFFLYGAPPYNVANICRESYISATRLWFLCLARLFFTLDVVVCHPDAVLLCSEHATSR